MRYSDDPAELEKEIDNLKIALIETKETTLALTKYWLDTRLLLSDLRKAIHDVAKGAAPTPWRTGQPRILIYRDQWEKLLIELDQPDPKLLTAEQAKILQQNSKSP